MVMKTASPHSNQPSERTKQSEYYDRRAQHQRKSLTEDCDTHTLGWENLAIASSSLV